MQGAGAPDDQSDRDRNRRKFAWLSRLYDPAVRHLPGRPHHRLVARVAAIHPPPARVLDLCCGTGLTTRLVAAALPGADVSGLDASGAMLEVARDLAARAGQDRIDFTTGDAAALPWPDRTFDLVTVSLGLHELPDQVRAAALDEVRRVLRPGAHLVALDLDRPHGRLGRRLVDLYLRVGEPPHARAVLGQGLVTLLRRHGFEVERAETLVGGVFQLITAWASAAAD